MKSEKVIQVVNQKGIPFNARIHEKNGKKIVSFYDARFSFTDYGQKVSEYFASTIAEHHNNLILDLGVSDWQVSHENIKEIQEHLDW